MRYPKSTLRFVILLTALTMLLAACGGGQQTGGQGQAPAGSKAAAAPTTAAGPAAPAGQATAPAVSGAPAAPAAGATSPAASGAAGATPGAAAKAGGAAPTAGTCPDTAKGQTVTMWSPLTGPDGRFMTDLANRFSQQNTQGINVNHLPQPEYIQKLNASAAARNLPELTVIRFDDIPEMAARNVIKPMPNDALGILGANIQADFPASLWSAGDYKGQRYAVPLDVHPLVLYYNKDMFKAAGLAEPGDKPMNKADFEKAIDALNKNNVQGISLGTAFQGATLFMTLLQQFGGSMASEDGTKAAYNSDAGVRALTYLNDMKKKYSPQASGPGDPEVKLFQQGRAAMVIHGPWHISDMEKLPFVGFAPVPQIGDRYAMWGGSHQLALTTDDPAKAAASACWISWLSANSLDWAKAGQVPIRNSVRASADLKTAAPAIAPVAEEAASVLVWPKVPGIVPALWGEGVGPAIDAVLAGQQTDIKAALDQAAAKSNQIIEQNIQRYGR